MKCVAYRSAFRFQSIHDGHSVNKLALIDQLNDYRPDFGGNTLAPFVVQFHRHLRLISIQCSMALASRENLTKCYTLQIDSDRDRNMRKMTVLGRAIYFMTENNAYPAWNYADAESFCVWHDEEGLYWLDVFYQREWRRASPEPFADFEEVFEAVKAYDYVLPLKR